MKFVVYREKALNVGIKSQLKIQATCKITFDLPSAAVFCCELLID